MAYGDSLGVTLPEVLVTPGATAAGMINAAIQACVDRLESQVTVAGLDINADLSMQSGATPFGLIDVHRVSFYDQTSALNAVTYPQALYAVGSDLYFNDDAGNQVRIVTAGGVDVSVAGGITGAGYGVSGVEVNWDGTNYNFKNAAGADAYASVVVDDVLLRDASGNAIRLAAPAGMAADYTITLPGAVPAAQSFMTMDNAGAVAAPAVYAAGTFTPILQNAGADHAGGYTTQQGYYLRVGNVVWYQIDIVATSLNPAGTLRIKVASLPVAPSTSTVTVQSGFVGEFTGGGGSPTVSPESRIDANGIYIEESGTNGHFDWSALVNGTYQIRLAGFYLVA